MINLASKEYFQSVKPELIEGEIITVDFRENRNGELKVISFNAKKARGKMAQLIVKEGITEKEGIKDLQVDGYVFSENGSDENKYLFVKN